MKKDRTSLSSSSSSSSQSLTTMGLNFLLLLVMVSTNLLSLYHLSSSSPPSPSPSASLPSSPSLLLHLHSLRSALSHPHSAAPPPPELRLLSALSPLSSACASHPTLLRQYMNYTPFSQCPDSSSSIAESLILRGCHPLPRRRCFSSSSSVPSVSNPNPSRSFISPKSTLDLTVPQLLRLAQVAGAAPIRLAIDVAGGDASLAGELRRVCNTTTLTTTLNLGQPFSQIAAARGFVTLHAPLQATFPVQGGVIDLVRTGHAVNRWVPAEQLEFLVYDVDRVLRPGGLFWIDHFFCKKVDLDSVYKPIVDRMGYKVIKWAVGDKMDGGGMRNKEVYLTALLQKPFA